MTELEPAVDDLRGTFVPATVTGLTDMHVSVSLPGGVEGLIPRSDFGRVEGEPAAVGDAFEVYVEQESGERYLVSRDKALRMAGLNALEKLHADDAVIEGEVVSATQGGFAVDIGVRAFCPASQISLRPVRDPDELLGQTFRFKIIRFQKARQNIVLSRRALLEREQDKTFGRLKVGALVEGTVRRFAEFGAFVDIGGVEGLLHVGDMSWGRVSKPGEVVSIGQELTLKVLRFDKKAKRISLGLRQCQDDPWLGVPAKYTEGTRVKGLVVSKTDFGCFIEVEPGVEGLVHSTGPMVTATAKKVLDKTDIGDELEARVLDVDQGQKRMSLALFEAE
ncbi:MAG: S1 RNA-binding domain-containing protein [Myxococcales bacterium]|nr:S1 RNA-binding domain-containing protein [Myxococcales bacterium]MCB9650279.1 S1 RNA-binding domain-containing protein [Deltaproteobacteria bacterium]